MILTLKFELSYNRHPNLLKSNFELSVIQFKDPNRLSLIAILDNKPLKQSKKLRHLKASSHRRGCSWPTLPIKEDARQARPRLPTGLSMITY